MKPALRTIGIIMGTLLAAGAAGAAPYAEFMVSYWDGPPAAETSLERYREVADCGFNVAMTPCDYLRKIDVKTNLKILDACKAVGIKAIVYDGRLFNAKGELVAREPPELERTLDAIVADYSSHPALAGYFMADEPNSSQFPLLAAISRHLLKKDPERLPYANLFPNYASAEQLGNGSYREHVSQYIATVKPLLVSWDHYQPMAGNERPYFVNLEIVRGLCLKNRLPFAQFILSLPHWSYRNPSEADLRWQVYTSLAYGAKGIMYYTYWTPPPERKLGDGPAIISGEGKRDAKYEMVRRINRRLRALGPLLMRLRSTGVYHTAPLPPGTRPLDASAPVEQAGGGPMVIGCFRDNAGRRYVFVVNRSFDDDLLAGLTMDKKTASAAELSQETGRPLEAVALKGRNLEVSLKAGEGRLFLLEDQ